MSEVSAVWVLELRCQVVDQVEVHQDRHSQAALVGELDQPQLDVVGDGADPPLLDDRARTGQPGDPSRGCRTTGQSTAAVSEPKSWICAEPSWIVTCDGSR